MRSRGILATALTALTALAGIAAAGTPSVRPPAVQLVEAGEDGVLYTGSIPVLDLDLVATEPFRGVLVARLVDEETLEELERVTLPIHAEPGRQRHVVAFTFVPDRLSHENTGDFRWELFGSDGSRIDEGSATTRAVDDSPPLFLTRLPGPGIRRDPARLSRAAHRLVGHRALILAGSDLASLAQDQVDALLDATSLGAELIITPPLEPLPAAMQDLARDSVLAWEGGEGHSVRECRFGRGHVRFTTLSVENLASESPRWPTEVALHPAGLVPSLAGFASQDGKRLPQGASSFGGISQDVGRLAGQWERARRAWWAAFGSLSLTGLGVIAFLSAARSQRWSPGPRGLALGLGLLALSVPLAAALLSRLAATSPPFVMSILVHDLHGLSVVQHDVFSTDGSGGFVHHVAGMDRAPEILTTSSAEHGTLRSWVEEGAWRVEVNPLGRGNGQIDLRATKRMPGSRSWDTDISWQGDELKATLTPLEDFDEAVLVMGDRSVVLGAARRGVPHEVGPQILAAPAARRWQLPSSIAFAVWAGLATWGHRSPWDGVDHLAIVSQRGENPLLIDVQPIQTEGPAPSGRAWMGMSAILASSAESPKDWEDVFLEVPASAATCATIEGRVHVGVVGKRRGAFHAAVVSTETLDDTHCRLRLDDIKLRTWPVTKGVTRRPVHIAWIPAAMEALP